LVQDARLGRQDRDELSAASGDALVEGARPPPARARQRLTWVDAAIAAVVAALFAVAAWRTNAVLDYRWNWGSVWPFIVKIDPATGSWQPNIILLGLATTLRLAVLGILIAGLIGVVTGYMRASARLAPRLIAGAYVMIVRNIPPVVFVFIFVFFIASQIMPSLGIADRVRTLGPTAQWWLALLVGDLRLIENFVVGLLCLSIFSGAYVTEIVRAGLQSVPRAQVEAGESVGLSRMDVQRFVVFPQALRNVLPPLAGQFIQLIKDSSLVSLVSIQELTFMAQDVQVATRRVFEVFLLVAVIYFVICFGLSRLFAWLEARAARAHR
jgi:polar amino acid transport system permease protein